MRGDLTPPAPLPCEGRGEPVMAGRRAPAGGPFLNIRNGPLREAILRVLGMLRRHAFRGGARDGLRRLPVRRVGRVGGAPGSLGARNGAVVRAARSRGPVAPG